MTAVDEPVAVTVTAEQREALEALVAFDAEAEYYPLATLLRAIHDALPAET